MFSLSIVKGRQAGQQVQIDRYPFSIGSGKTTDLCIEDEGVWPEHLTIKLEPGGSPQVQRGGDGFVTVNDEPIELLELRQGDRIGLGAVQLTFHLSSVRRRGLHHLNILTWAMIVGVALLEIILISTIQSV